MKGRDLGVNQSWVCCGVSAGSPVRNCPSLLYEVACYGHHRCSHQDFEERGGKLRGIS